MKQTILLLIFTLFISFAFAQSNQWSWLKGDNSIPQLPYYGIQGVPAPQNQPGARLYAASWTDPAGDMWLFGGYGLPSSRISGAGYLNDLWKYSTHTGQWTWVSGDYSREQTGSYGTKGVTASANKPGSRECPVTWTDAAGSLWMFGGYGFTDTNFGYLGDMWKFVPSTGQWTWISGDNVTNQSGIYGTRGTALPVNKPGSRQAAVSWTDTSGNLWLFGGYGYATDGSGLLNDLWKFNTSTGQWTWISGDNLSNQSGVYGTKGVAGSSNKPESRDNATSWADASGNLWLFGGMGYTSANYGSLNDLWKFSASTGQWTWMSGDNIPNQTGVYGTKGIAAPGNKPGVRQFAVSYTDTSGNLWLSGGNGYAHSASGYLNDLWRYSISTGQWTWVKGDSTTARPGIYGTKRVADSANMPGARYAAVPWIDKSGNLWLFGGNGYITNSSSDIINDLWKYSISTGQWTWMSGDNNRLLTGVYGTQGTSAAGNKPGGRYGGVNWSDASGNLWLFGGIGYTADLSGTLNDMWKYTTSTGQWTWVNGSNNVYQFGIYGTKGAAAPGNAPGARYGAVQWTDALGNFWLLGGNGYAAGASGNLNDLWKYTPVTGQWTWMSGDSIPNQTGIYSSLGNATPVSKPGARLSALSWADLSGNLWLFGGNGYAAGSTGILNDLWKYSTTTGLWTWINGDSIPYQAGVYNLKSTADAANKPGAREGAVGWTDKAGNLWLFGGHIADNMYNGSSNDLWKYIPSTGQWTWISGDNIPDQQGVYGNKGMSAFTNKPGARVSDVSWTDAAGNFWIFGGSIANSSSPGYINDTWRYTPSTGQWTWISGDSIPYQFGVYGVQGTAASTNKPGARYGAAGWADAAGKLWMFGGAGYASNGGGRLNDLWLFSTAAISLPVKFSSFTARKQQNNVLLNWTTFNEQNNLYFEVERSSTGEAYDTIGKVAGVGTTSAETSYSFLDIDPRSGTNYYRIKQVDQDGRTMYSVVEKIVMEEAATRFAIIQNPVHSSLQLSVDLPYAQKLTLQVMDIHGHLLISEERMGNKGSSVYSFPVERIAEGAYLIILHTKNGSSTKTFIKQ